jgi:hypothetical protein
MELSAFNFVLYELVLKQLLCFLLLSYGPKFCLLCCVDKKRLQDPGLLIGIVKLHRALLLLLLIVVAS